MQGTIDLTLDMVFEKSLRTLGEPALNKFWKGPTLKRFSSFKINVAFDNSSLRFPFVIPNGFVRNNCKMIAKISFWGYLCAERELEAHTWWFCSTIKYYET